MCVHWKRRHRGLSSTDRSLRMTLIFLKMYFHFTSCLLSRKRANLGSNLGFFVRRGILLAPADSRVSDACREQRCLNIFARIRNVSFIIRRPSFNLEIIG